MGGLAGILPSMKLRSLVAAALAAISLPVLAGGTQSGQITQIAVRASDGLIVVYMSGTATGRPSCGASQPYWIVKDENSTTGKQQLAALMAARTTGQNVTITGLGTCTRWSDGEDINMVSF